MPHSSRPAGHSALFLVMLLCGCVPATPMPPAGQGNFTLNPAGTPLTTANAPLLPGEAAKTPSLAPAAPAATGGQNGQRPPAAPFDWPGADASFLLLPGGRIILRDPTDAIAVPAGTDGVVSYFSPGRIPESLGISAGQTFTLHPAPLYGSPAPTRFATLQGNVVPARAGLALEYLARGRSSFMGAVTQADGSFSFQVPEDGSEQGLLLARELNDYPALAIAPVSIASSSITVVPPMTLAPPLPGSDLFSVAPPEQSPQNPAIGPSIPPGLSLSAASVEILGNDAQGPWRALLLAKNTSYLPIYALPDFTWINTYVATSSDGTSASEISGPPGTAGDFLAPPDLSGMPGAFAQGQPAWPAVAGAGFYTLRLTTQSGSPLWEAGSASPGLPLPAGLAIAGQPLLLQVDAWDAPEVNAFSIADIKALRIPTEAPTEHGRHSWTTCRLPVQ